MILKKLHLPAGLKRPVKVLHVADTHLAYADERDNARKRKLALQRSGVFERHTGDCLDHFVDAIEYSEKHCDALIHSGDLIDFVSYANLDLVREKLKNVSYFITAGNHEFSQYVGEAEEDLAYKMRSLPQVQPSFENNLLFSSKLIGGVNFVGVDNSYYQFTFQQLEQFKAEVEKGYPMILLLHCPLHTDGLYEKMLFDRKAKSALSVGCPERLMEPYSELTRNKLRPTEPTIEFLRYVDQSKRVKAVLAGHLHVNLETALPSGIPQYVAGGGFHGCACEFYIS